MTLLILSLTLQAEEPKIVYKENTEIDFESVEIEGQLKKPQGSLISEQNRALFNPLVNIRTNWSSEMIESINQID